MVPLAHEKAKLMESTRQQYRENLRIVRFTQWPKKKKKRYDRME